MSSAPSLSTTAMGWSDVPSVATARGGRSAMILAGIALIFSAVVYYPITRTFFFADDFFHLYQISNQSHLQFLLNNHAGHLYLTRNALFLLCWNLFGADERWSSG